MCVKYMRTHHFLPRARADMGKLVAFIRHGEAVHNPHLQASKKESDPEKKAELYAKGISFLDPELTEKGVQQAEGLRDRLARDNKTYDVVVVSPLRRTIQTAHIALSGRAALFVIDPESTETADPIWGLPQRVRFIISPLHKSVNIPYMSYFSGVSSYGYIIRYHSNTVQ